MNYKVTLAMPVYNVEKYVERALLSALNQTFDSIEFLIVDDKGTDRSMEIVSEIVSTHPRGKDVRIIDHVVNQGTGATKNSAIREAKGEYLFFMDSDDCLSRDCILSLYHMACKNDADIVIGSFSYCDVEGKSIAKNILKDICYQGNDVFGKFFFAKGFYVQTWNKFYIAYMIDLDKYFVYPYVSFTNDFGSSGVHHTNQSNICTTSLFFGINKKYLFRDFDKSSIYVYDCFFQMRKRNLILNDREYDVCFDLYSTKDVCNIDTNYVITSKTIKKPIISFASIHIPFEYNILTNEGGGFFYLTTKNEYKKQSLAILKKETLRMKMYVPDMIKYVCYKIWRKIFK